MSNFTPHPCMKITAQSPLFSQKKRVCPNGHTSWDENELTCSKCGIRCIEITRFIQIKTREVNGNKEEERSFGYTLTSKDFRTDPHHVFLLFSDFTLDFIILPMYDYLKFFYDNKVAGSTHFSTPSFRKKKKNNKMNQLKVTEDGNWGVGNGKRTKQKVYFI